MNEVRTVEILLIVAIVVVTVLYWRQRGYGIASILGLVAFELVAGLFFLLWQRT